MKKKIGLYLAGILALATVAYSALIYNGTLTNETALAYDKSFPLDLQALSIESVSAQVTYSSATIPAVTFGDGTQSTGSFTVSNYAALNAASATNRITVVTNVDHTNATITLPGYVFRNGVDWATRDVSSNTAESIKLALAKVPWLSVSRAAGSSIVYATATVGSFYNSAALISSDAEIVALTPFFNGGQDNAVVKINGVALRAGLQFTAATANSNTATSLASAINTAMGSLVTASASGAVVTATSTLNGLARNFALLSSTPTAIAASGATMTGGTSSAYALGGTAITIASHGLTTALPVLYVEGSNPITNLTTQTTYYAIPLTANTVGLATTKVAAAAGTAIVLASSSTHLTANTYTLSPLPITGIPSFKWQVSNDNLNWYDLAVTSITIGPTGDAYATPPSSVIWSFGYIGPRYLRLKVLGPTTGGISLQTTIAGSSN